MPAFDNASIMAGRTLFPSTVRSPLGNHRVLKSAANNRKIGGTVLKGEWKDLLQFTLTLPERSTCPHSCHHWRSCMGNHMQWAERFEPGEELAWKLEREVRLLLIDNPEGIVIRAHILGDFYSVPYVGLWERMTNEHERLFVWGFTARHDTEHDPIAVALIELVRRQPRFRIRFSNAPLDLNLPSTISIEHPYQLPADAVLCAEQVGKTESCSTCSLCWSSPKRVAFLQH